MPCNYRRQDGRLCGHEHFPGERLCVFHALSEPLSVNKENNVRESFKAKLPGLIAEKQGDWEGFVFPIALRLAEEKIDFEVNARGARFREAVSLEKLTFLQRVVFDGATFEKPFIARGVEFAKEARFDFARFEQSCELQHVQFRSPASFHRVEFSGPVMCRAQFASQVSFAEASFGDRTHFAGWRNIDMTVREEVLALDGTSADLTVQSASATFGARVLAAVRGHLQLAAAAIRRCWRVGVRSVKHLGASVRDRLVVLRHRYSRTSAETEIFSVFGSEVEFTDVDFATPTLVSFSGVDMSRAYLLGTNLRGVRFLNVIWWQPDLRRNGLHDEVFISKSQDGPFRWRSLPALEETCRNLRLALEESKSYAAAADFYVGEMEAQRARLGFWKGSLFSVPAWYAVLTRYGTSVTRGLIVLACLIVSHALATAILRGFQSADIFNQLPELLLRSIRIATFQRDESGLGTLSEGWIDMVFRIFTAIQIALLVFAFRTRIKRH